MATQELLDHRAECSHRSLDDGAGNPRFRKRRVPGLADRVGDMAGQAPRSIEKTHHLEDCRHPGDSVHRHRHRQLDEGSA